MKKKNIKIIEDCAQAHGTKFFGKHVGTFGDLGTFSFFPGKNLGGFGDGGAIVTNSRKIYNYCLRARNHGALGKYDHTFSGRNSRLDTINAAVLNIKLKSYNNVVRKRNKLAKLYFNGLKEIICSLKFNFGNSFKIFLQNTSFNHFFSRSTTTITYSK